MRQPAEIVRTIYRIPRKKPRNFRETPSTTLYRKALHKKKSCATLNRSKIRGQIQGTTERELERTESRVDRTVPDSCEGYRLAGSADRASEREDQLLDDASQVSRQTPCVTARVDQDGQHAPAAAGRSPQL